MKNKKLDKNNSVYPEIKVIEDAGFSPIGVTVMGLEDTFIFETAEEAQKAYEVLETGGRSRLSGWWYGKGDFEEYAPKYEKEFGDELVVYWKHEK